MKHEINNFVSLKEISLKNHPNLNEQWVQNVIENEPKIMGLGDLEVIQREKRQKSQGRVDFLMEDKEDNRYTVEIQLGKTDPEHIVRCIEYWDEEKKRNPSKDYTAVIIAEDITSRFFNVINLFNGCIPIIAIKLSCIEISPDNYTLVFTKILDKIERDDVDDVEDKTPTDKQYWLNCSTVKSLDIVDGVFNIFTGIDDNANKYKLNYNKFYIGLSKNSISNNFIHFRPRKQFVHLHIRRDKTSDIEEVLKNASLEYSYKGKHYWITITESNLKNDEDIKVIKSMMVDAYKEFGK